MSSIFFDRANLLLVIIVCIDEKIGNEIVNLQSSHMYITTRYKFKICSISINFQNEFIIHNMSLLLFISIILIESHYRIYENRMWQFNKESNKKNKKKQEWNKEIFRFISSFSFSIFFISSLSLKNFKPAYNSSKLLYIIFIFYFRNDLEIFHKYINTLYMVEMLFENACASTLRMNLIHLSCTSRSHHQTSLNFAIIHMYMRIFEHGSFI